MTQRKDGEPGMTPMIDVVFLLLIFFMCASKFRIPEGALRAYLPKDSGTGTIHKYVKNCRIQLWLADTGEVRARIDEKNVALLVLNTKDHDQLAMHGLAYPLAVELNHVPLLLL